MPDFLNGGHIDRVLNNISVAYMQGPNAFIADKVFPIIPVTKQSDIYYQYSKADMFRNEVQERGKGVESAGGDWNITTKDPYHCRKYAYHYDISPEERITVDAPLNIDRDTVQWLADKMLLKREIDFSNTYLKTGVWGTDLQGADTAATGKVVKWSVATSDPVADINNIMLTMASKTGKKPNFAIMSPDVFYTLKRHEDIMDRIKYTQKGVITLDLIASLFELEKIYIPWGVVNTGAQTPKYDETLDATDFIYSGKMLIGYTASRPSLKEPTAGYIFSWTGLEGASSFGSRLVRLRMDMLGIGTERLEMEMAYDMKLICADMGTYLYDLI